MAVSGIGGAPPKRGVNDNEMTILFRMGARLTRSRPGRRRAERLEGLLEERSAPEHDMSLAAHTGPRLEDTPRRTGLQNGSGLYP